LERLLIYGLQKVEVIILEGNHNSMSIDTSVTGKRLLRLL
jgi:hypothetical protein